MATAPVEHFQKRFMARSLWKFHFTIDDVVSEGNMVAARWTARMTHRGEYLGVAATQKQLTVTGMVFVRIGDGKIQEGWNNWDQHTVTRELGLPLR
jgi:predicted ester cyclase